MKKKNLPALGFALALLLVFVIAAAIDYRALNSNQFTTSGTVSVISGAQLTNAVLRTPGFDTLKSLGGLTVIRSISNNIGQSDLELSTGIGQSSITINHSTITNLLLRDPLDGTTVVTIIGGIAYLGGTGISNLNASSLASGTVAYGRLLSSPTTVYQTGTDLWLNAALGRAFVHTLTNSCQINITNGTVDEQIVTIRFKQDGTGNRLVTATNMDFGSDITGISVTPTANYNSRASFMYVLESNIWQPVGNIRMGDGVKD